MGSGGRRVAEFGRRGALATVLIVVALSAGTGCSSAASSGVAEPPPAASPDPTTVGDPTALEIRPVLALRPAKGQDCDQPAQTSTPDVSLTVCSKDGAQVYELGPAQADASEVVSASATASPGSGDWAVNVTLNAEGTAAFLLLTQTGISLPEPRNQIALVSDGTVISAPRVINPIIDGTFQISGLSESEAKALAQRLEPSPDG